MKSFLIGVPICLLVLAAAQIALQEPYPRITHKVYAKFAGYFWVPCPKCGRPFGGHEWRSGDSIPEFGPNEVRDTEGKLVEGAHIERHTGICHECAERMRAE